MNDRASRGNGGSMTHSRKLAGALAAVLALAASAAVADDTKPFHAIVSGGAAGAAERVARAIESELDRPVVLLASDAACPAPCASVVIDGRGTATVRLTSDQGELRQRTISVPRDPAGTAEVIALLVGNLARDEASAIIEDIDAEDAGAADASEAGAPEADLDAPVVDDAEAPGTDEVSAEAPVVTDGGGPVPEPEAAAGVPPTPVAAPGVVLVPGALATTAPPLTDSAASPEADGRTSLSIGLVPYVGLRFGGAYRRGLSIYAIAGYSHESHVLSLAGAVDVVRGDVYGAQIGGAVATAGRVRGFQIAGAVAYAGKAEGVQVGGAVAASNGGAGVQIAGAASYANGTAGTQIAGAVATARGGAGVQIAGAVNTSGGSVGTQIAGAVNVARGHVYGAQIGVVNVAGEVDGVQIGVVNVARKSDGGLSLGLINVVPGGRSELEATFDTDRVGALMFRHGGKRWHNVYGIGGRAGDENFNDVLDDKDMFMYGFGFGPTFHAGGLVIDVDAIAWHVVYGNGTEGHADLLAQLRLVGAMKLGGIQVIGGAAVNTYITTDPLREGFAERRGTTPMDSGARVMISPSFFAGVRI
jgi:hypothetical protein